MSDLTGMQELNCTRIDAAKRMSNEIHRQSPDYPFARIAMAQFAIANSRLDDAQELFKPFITKTQWHGTDTKPISWFRAGWPLPDTVSRRQGILLAC